MLHHAVVFLGIALVAMLIGVGGIASGAASLAQVLFFLFLVYATVSLVTGLVRGRE